MLAAKSGWNEPVLQRAFRRRLSDAVRDAVIWGARPRDLDELIDRAVDIDNYQGERRREQASRHAPPRSPSRCCPSPLRSPARIRRPLSASSSQQPGKKPMKLGHVRLSATEQSRRLSLGSCLYCGQEELPLSFLVDSGTDDSFIPSSTRA